MCAGQRIHATGLFQAFSTSRPARSATSCTATGTACSGCVSSAASTGLTGPAGPTGWRFTHMDELTLKDPFPLRIAFGELGRLTGPPDHPDVIDKVFPPGSAAGQGQ